MRVVFCPGPPMSGDDCSSSSEDEITKRILSDSIDTELLTNNLYKKSPADENNVKNTIDTNSTKTKPSLRYINEDDGHDHNYIKVTPEFQEFVAKNLFKHLESQIIEKKSKHKKCLGVNTENCPKGIHLFKGSTKLLDSFMTNEPTNTTKRKRHLQNTSNKLILQQSLDVAVSSEWILNKDAIQGWAKTTKGKVMKVKSNKEGSFDIVNDEF